MKLKKPLFFTQHQLGRMAKRGMSKKIVQAVVEHGDWNKGKVPYSFEVSYKGIIVVLYEQKTQYNVSSCKLDRENTKRAERMKMDAGMDFWRAVHKIVKGIDFTQEIANMD